MWDVNGCHRLLGMMGIEHHTLWDVTLEKNAMTTCWDGTSRKAWLQLTFSHLSVCMCMCCSYGITPCLKKNNNIKHGESMSILAPLLQTANKLTSTWSTTFIYPPFIKHGHFPHPRPSPSPASLMPPLLGATAGVFPTMPESGTTVVEQLLEVQKKSAPSRSVQRTQVLGSPNDLMGGQDGYTAIPCKQCVIYISFYRLDPATKKENMFSLTE